jgi:serpin B
VYFLGGWAEEFPKDATKDAPFYRTPDDKLDVPTMYQRESFAYAEDVDLQVLSLPYRDRALSMVIVLPKDRAGLAAAEKKLTGERFAAWIKDSRSDCPVDVYLPKFKLRSQLKLSEALNQLAGRRPSATPPTSRRCRPAKHSRPRK